MHHSTKLALVLIAILLTVSLGGCCSATTARSEEARGATAVATEPKPTAQAQADAPAAQPSSTPEPTAVPPTPAPTQATIGASRSNPFPRSEVVHAPHLDVQVLETKRGDAAWQDLQAANQFNKPAPEGMEYLLVKVHVKNTSTESDDPQQVGAGDFDVTGSHLVRYSTAMAVPPKPVLDAELYPGGEAEGWISYLIPKDEGQLILIVDEMWNSDEDGLRFIALDEGAAIAVATELESIQANDLGRERANPAPLGEKAVTEDWEVVVREVHRGDEALALVQKANQFNHPPDEGMEYVAVKVSLRLIGTGDQSVNVSGADFKATGSQNVVYDMPMAVGPDPELDANLYPGGEAEGWIVLQVAKGETGLILVFDPVFEFLGANQRYLALE